MVSSSFLIGRWKHHKYPELWLKHPINGIHWKKALKATNLQGWALEFCSSPHWAGVANTGCSLLMPLEQDVLCPAGMKWEGYTNLHWAKGTEAGRERRGEYFLEEGIVLMDIFKYEKLKNNITNHSLTFSIYLHFAILFHLSHSSPTHFLFLLFFLVFSILNPRHLIHREWV